MQNNDEEHSLNCQKTGNDLADSSINNLAAIRFSLYDTLKTYAIYAAVTPLALLHSLSIAIFAIYISQAFNLSEPPTLVEKIALPALPWTIIAAACTWLYWNGIGKRANGAEDAPIISSTNRINLPNDTLRVSIAIFATLPSFTSGTLGILASQAAGKRNFTLIFIVASLLGLLSFTVGMLTDVVSCFRKHVEYCEGQNQPIKSLFNQSLVKPFYDKAACLGVAIRELYPLLNSIVRAQACDQIMTFWLSQSALPTPAINIIRLICAILLYSGTAYTLKNFDVAQLQQGLDAEGRGFSVDNYLTQLKSHFFLPLRILGNMLNGQLLFDNLKRCFSLKTSTNIMVGLNGISLAGLAQRNLCTYVSCDNADATRAGVDSFLTRYLLGTKAAVEVAPKLTWFLDSIALGGGAAASAIKAPMVQKQARETEEQYALGQTQITPS